MLVSYPCGPQKHYLCGQALNYGFAANIYAPRLHRGEKELRTALEMAPNDADAQNMLATLDGGAGA